MAAALLPAAVAAAPASAFAVSPATNFTELSDSFATGGTVVLANDITQTGQELNVGAGKSVTLDFAGHTLSVTGVPAGRRPSASPPAPP